MDLFFRQFTPALRRGIGAGAAAGFLFGFDTAVIAGSTALLQQQFHLNARALGWTVSVALWGTVLGSLVCGRLGQRLGSRTTLRVLAAFYLVSALGCAWAPSWMWLVIARFLGGVGVGGSSVIGPVYVAELAPPAWRGRMVGLFQINVVVGVLLAYFSNYLLQRWQPGPGLWRWQLGIAFVPASALLLMLIRVPESPRWLSTRGRHVEALTVLVDLGFEDAARELDGIEVVNRQDFIDGKTPLLTRSHLKPLLLAAGLGAFNQLSGINAILYYMNDIFEAAGFSRLSSSSLAVVVGFMNLIATGIAVSVIDRLGRRRLLIIGSIGMCAALIAVTLLLARHEGRKSLAALLGVYMFFFAISQGTVIWVYLSEIFPNAVRARGQSIGTTTHWIMNAIIAGVFPLMAVHGMALPFGFFAAMMALQLIFVVLYLPETRGLTLEAIAGRMTGAPVRAGTVSGAK